MFRHCWTNYIVSILLIVLAGSCDGLGAGCGCTTRPLPAGGLPADQTLEGGAQIRVTPAGFQKFTALIPPLINDALSGGFCIPRNQVVDIGVAEATICGTNAGTCRPGCPVNISLESTAINASDQTINLKVRFDVQSPVHVGYDVIGFDPGQCNATMTLNDGLVDMDVRLGIRPSNGALTIEPVRINRIDVTGIRVSSGNCGGLAAIVDTALNLFAELLDSFLGDLVIDLLQPIINDFFQGFLPDPLGIEGAIDVGGLLAGMSSGTTTALELRAVPGGFVQLTGGGMTLGMIVGVNSDKDTSTRTPALDSEPVACVPQVPAPDFAAAPVVLPRSPRGTFILAAAEEFRGSPEVAADVAIGVSETALDLAGHHAVTSGAMCLAVGTETVPQLQLGLFGLLVPSFAALGDAKAPLLMMTRPQGPIDLSIGDGTTSSPSLRLHLKDLEIDFYAFLYERYVRGFTLSLTVDAGVNLELTTTADGQPALMPMLVGLDARSIGVKALNTELLRETPAELEATMPTVLNLALPMIAGSLPEIVLPELGGFRLSDLETTKLVTSEDEFLAILGTLELPGSTPLTELRAQPGSSETLPARAQTRARLRSVTVPEPERIRAGLAGRADGALPEVIIDVEPRDQLGRPLEWTWRLQGGMWRPFTAAAPLVIRDRALVWQGRHTIEIAARVAGDYRTLDHQPVAIPVVIDSAGPRIHEDEVQVADSRVIVPVSDLVSPDSALQVAYGRPSEDAPATAWASPAGLAIDQARNLAERTMHDGQPRLSILVYARDQQGNQSAALVDLPPTLGLHGSSGSSGCTCAAGPVDADSAGGMAVLAILTALFLHAGNRRMRSRSGRVAAFRPRLGTMLRSAGPRRVAGIVLYAGAALALSAMPACSCGGAATGPVCAVDPECDVVCAEGSIGYCIDGECLCGDDVSYGKIGAHADMALAADGTVWVSAYNSTHGDLNVASWSTAGPIDNQAWSFVDGVPSGPVEVARSEIRGGITAAGENVGTHTSIAVLQDGGVIVSYHDVDRVSLKAAIYTGGTWQLHTVDQGIIRQGQGPSTTFQELGQYSAVTIGPDGRPGIAYFAHLADGSGTVRTEVRFASAASPTPAGPLDWNIYTVDFLELPAARPQDPLLLPPGVGLFIDSTRLSDGSPVMAYYDRENGNLKLAVFDPVLGRFQLQVLDGADGSDVGWHPALTVDAEDVVHVSYVSASRDDLLYINTADRMPEVVDDGYRVVGTTPDGLPKPEYHRVGDDSSIVITERGPVIAYQDATTHELLAAHKNPDGTWRPETLAGAEQPFAGGFGFYASAAYDGVDVVISTMVLDPPNDRTWVEVVRADMTAL